MDKKSVTKIQKDLRAVASSEKARLLQRFFKTGKGDYGEGDKFLGIVVPACRQVAKRYYAMASLKDVEVLLKSQWHEERQIALFLLVLQFDQADEAKQKQIFDLFLKNTRYINNWDLVDCNAPRIVGKYIYQHQKLSPLLEKLAKSKSLWERRIAIISTLYFTVKGNNPAPTLRIAKMLLKDKHDLIHKAVGWMLREVGKRCNEKILCDFLDQHARAMPRTMLRYAIERFDEKKRQAYLKLK